MLLRRGNAGWAVAAALTLGLASTLVASAAPPPITGGPATMIAGGEQVSSGPTPAVALYTDHGFRCGGTLIAWDTVLTAAHCVTDEDVTPPKTTERFYVRVGDTDRTQGQIHQVTQVTWNPGWTWAVDAPALGDLAVLHLGTAVAGVLPAQLGRETLPVGTIVHLVGWGYEGSPLPGPFPAPQIPDGLRTVDMRVAGPLLCTGAAPGVGPHEDCLTPVKPVSGPCFGDSGSASMWGTQVAGIVSRGNNNTPVGPCEVDDPVVTRVADFASWIAATEAQQRAAAA